MRSLTSMRKRSWARISAASHRVSGGRPIVRQTRKNDQAKRGAMTACMPWPCRASAARAALGPSPTGPVASRMVSSAGADSANRLRRSSAEPPPATTQARPLRISSSVSTPDLAARACSIVPRTELVEGGRLGLANPSALQTQSGSAKTGRPTQAMSSAREEGRA